MQSDDSAGNQSVLIKIKLLLGKGSFPGAAIFTGPEGAGKYETAVRAARALNCLAPEKPHGEGCGECLSCRKLDPQGEIKHLDVLAIRPEGRWFKIDQVRHIRREIYYRPYEGKKRVFILVQADKRGIVSEIQFFACPCFQRIRQNYETLYPVQCRSNQEMQSG